MFKMEPGEYCYAKLGYETYCKAVAEKAGVSPEDTVKFEDLSKEHKDLWWAAANAIVEEC